MSESRNTRLRAAWLYYAHGLTQAGIATRLRLSRATVNKLLDTARSRGEVRIWLDEPADECLALALEIERALSVDEVIVVPGGPEGSTRAAGLALGRWLSTRIEHDMRVGVGWGRTLMAALEAFQPPRRDGVEVISLLGGQVRPALPDPAEFAWRMASALIAECGLDALFERAAALDIAVLSVGATKGAEGSLALRLLTESEQTELRAAGAVGDVLATFLDAAGAEVDHPANRRAMSVDLDRIARAKTRLPTATGADRARALRAARHKVEIMVGDDRFELPTSSM